MADRFEVGREYRACDGGYTTIRVLARSKKMINVVNDAGVMFRMLIRVDKDGTEYACEHCVPRKWKDELTYRATWEV